ncbi:hypothetical protein M8C21_003596, partial [Ambrosia artemisiifolia]
SLSLSHSLSLSKTTTISAALSSTEPPSPSANEYRRLERKPPVTAALFAANTIIYLRPSFLHQVIPPVDDVYFNAYLILKMVSRTF